MEELGRTLRSANTAASGVGHVGAIDSTVRLSNLFSLGTGSVLVTTTRADGPFFSRSTGREARTEPGGRGDRNRRRAPGT